MLSHHWSFIYFVLATYVKLEEGAFLKCHEPGNTLGPDFKGVAMMSPIMRQPLNIRFPAGKTKNHQVKPFN